MGRSKHFVAVFRNAIYLMEALQQGAPLCLSDLLFLLRFELLTFVPFSRSVPHLVNDAPLRGLFLGHDGLVLPLLLAEHIARPCVGADAIHATQWIGKRPVANLCQWRNRTGTMAGWVERLWHGSGFRGPLSCQLQLRCIH